MANKVKAETAPVALLTVYVPPTTLAAFKTVAVARGMTIRAAVAEALTDWLLGGEPSSE